MVNRKQLASDMIQAVWQDGDLDALDRYWTSDAVNHADADNVGLVSLREYHARFASSFDGFSDISIRIEHQIAEGDLVVTHLVTSGHDEATGRAVHLRTIRIDHLRDDRIAEHWSVVDRAGLTAQLR